MVKTSLYFSHLDVKPSYMVVCTVSVPQSHILNTLALGRKFIIICQGDFPPRQTEEQVISHTGISPQSDMEDLMILELPTNRPERYKLRHCHVGKISVIFLFFYRKKVNAIHVWLVLISWHNKLAHNKISATRFCLGFHPSPNFSKTSSTSATYSFFHVVYAPLKSWLHFLRQSPNAAREQPPPPITSPSCNVTPTAICMKCFLAAARARLQSEILRGGKRGKRCSENRRRGSLVFHIRGAARKNGLKARIRCPITKAERGGESRRAASLVSENGATRRGRARLCGGEHREEAQQKGLSQEHRRTFLHTCTWKGGWFFFFTSAFSGAYVVLLLLLLLFDILRWLCSAE